MLGPATPIPSACVTSVPRGRPIGSASAVGAELAQRRARGPAHGFSPGGRGAPPQGPAGRRLPLSFRRPSGSPTPQVLREGGPQAAGLEGVSPLVSVSVKDLLCNQRAFEGKDSLWMTEKGRIKFCKFEESVNCISVEGYTKGPQRHTIRVAQDNRNQKAPRVFLNTCYGDGCRGAAPGFHPNEAEETNNDHY